MDEEIAIFQEQSHEGLRSRLGGSLSGICFCLILFIGAFPSLVWWNEGRDVDMYNTINEGRAINVPKSKQRVVLLAGPHKTSSSSIQRNIYHWLNAASEENGTSSLSTQWAWPSPAKSFLEHGCEMDNKLESKIFYPFIEAIKGMHKSSRCITSFYSKREIIELYHDEIYKKWNQGYNLVIGSEAIDFIASERRNDGPIILNDLINELPWHLKGGNPFYGSDEDITAVVAYRAPRVDHLISLWHQCCMEDMSFYEYLTHRIRIVVDPVRSLDSLKLASVFLERGIETVLIDMSGVKALGYDMSNIVACDVLNAECNERKMFSGAQNEEVIIANTRFHSDENFNVTDAQLDRINDVIEMYDCNFMTMMQHTKFKVLYSNELDATLSKCNERKHTIHSRDAMVRQIIEITRDSTSAGEEILPSG